MRPTDEISIPSLALSDNLFKVVKFCELYNGLSPKNQAVVVTRDFGIGEGKK